ncbi:MAG: 4-hydroxy-tetrahydrodipicolinate reductase [Krumholzibacteria bacterium]|nr:4-hydroxy-tetrahydrodipicolinate reductase [Candidatus Krumholzibacteria bacterium]
MIDVAVHGAEGRMGRLVTALVEEAEDCRLAGLVGEPGRHAEAGACHPRLPLVGQQDLAAALPPGCVIVDFSLAPALDGLLAGAAALGAPLVIGTTGYDDAQRARLAAFAADHAVVHAANFSVGVPALQMLLQLLARTLPAGFDAEQTETHHVTKLDRPSGTARTLAAAWRRIRGGGEPPTHSLRVGGVVGEHTWTFADAEETLVLTHRAHSRRAFLRGVLPSVRFVARARPGLYDLGDVLRGPGRD